jgi:hypothetical protein
MYQYSQMYMSSYMVKIYKEDVPLLEKNQVKCLEGGS